MSSFIILHKIDTRSYREDEGDAPHIVPVAVRTDCIRCFNPRRQGAGTRITFSDGGGYAVTESGSEILLAMDHPLTSTELADAYSLAPPTAPTLTVIEGGDQSIN